VHTSKGGVTNVGA